MWGCKLETCNNRYIKERDLYCPKNGEKVHNKSLYPVSYHVKITLAMFVALEVGFAPTSAAGDPIKKREEAVLLYCSKQAEF